MQLESPKPPTLNYAAPGARRRPRSRDLALIVAAQVPAGCAVSAVLSGSGVFVFILLYCVLLIAGLTLAAARRRWNMLALQLLLLCLFAVWVPLVWFVLLPGAEC